MKIIHTADLHLGSSFVNLSQQDGETRNRELTNTFRRMVDYARANDVRAILLCGDVLDTKDQKYARIKDKKAFYDIIANNPDIQFYYLRGNHDNNGGYDGEEALENLHTFSNAGWSYYQIDKLTIAGIEIDADTMVKTYNDLALFQNGYNLVILHGPIIQGTFNDASVCTGYNIPLSALKNHNIDYLALGHIHSYQRGQLDQRGSWAYSGCLMGRGFDEAGDKGFVLIDTDTRTTEFVPFASNKVYTLDVDISEAENAHAAVDIVLDQLQRIETPERHILKVTLVGDVSFDPKAERLVETVQEMIQGFFYHKVVDATSRKYTVNEFEGENSLIGEFLKLVNNDPDLDENLKLQIKELGVNVLKAK